MTTTFRFRITGDDTLYTQADIPSFMEHPKYPSILEGYNKFRERNIDYERQWRNKELNGTDWMLVSDATYGGEPLVGSQYLEDIKVYRQSLREYNLTTDDRPEKPEWFK